MLTVFLHIIFLSICLSKSLNGFSKSFFFWAIAPTHQPSNITISGLFVILVHLFLETLSSIDLLNFGIDIIYPFGYSSISYSSNYGTSKGSNFGKQYSVGDILGLIGSNYRLNDKNEIGLNFGFTFKEEPYFNSSLYRSGYYFGFIRLKYSHKFSKSEK